MNGKKVDQLRKIHAENAAIFCFIQGVITSSPAPRLLMQRMQQAHDGLMADLLNAPNSDEVQNDLIVDEHKALMGRIEKFIEGLQQGRIPR